MKRSWVEISLIRLQENIAAVKARLAPSTRIIAVVKADAYGHGIQGIADCLSSCGICDFAVATLEEGIELRRFIGDDKILVLGGCFKGEEPTFLEFNLTAALSDSVFQVTKVSVEVEIDTGMNRLGIPWKEAAKFISSCPLHISGVFSHFACSDQDLEFTRLQLSRFEQATSDFPYPRHISNSAGLQLTEAHLDAVRPGLALYGISPCTAIDYLQPVLSWKTRVVNVREVPNGQSIGYGGTFIASRDMQIGILPIGYSDGYSRQLSNLGKVRIRGQLVPVIGRVAMDLVTIDLTDLQNPKVGEEVILLEDVPDSPISASGLSETMGTIPYEILTRIGARVERLYV